MMEKEVKYNFMGSCIWRTTQSAFFDKVSISNSWLSFHVLHVVQSRKSPNVGNDLPKLNIKLVQSPKGLIASDGLSLTRIESVRADCIESPDMFVRSIRNCR